MTDQVEARLRAALVARAGQITQDRLRFGTPPTLAPAPTRSPWRRWLPLPVGVGIAAGVLAFTLLPRSPETDPPVPPAGPVVVTPSSVPPAPTSSSTPSASPARSPGVSSSASPATSAPGKPAVSTGSPPDTAAPQVTPAG